MKQNQIGGRVQVKPRVGCVAFFTQVHGMGTLCNSRCIFNLGEPATGFKDGLELLLVVSGGQCLLKVTTVFFV